MTKEEELELEIKEKAMEVCKEIAEERAEERASQIRQTVELIQLIDQTIGTEKMPEQNELIDLLKRQIKSYIKAHSTITINYINSENQLPQDATISISE